MPEVLLKYHGQGEGFGPDKKQVSVKLNETLVFKLHPGTRGAIEGAKLRITIHNSQFFNKTVVSHDASQTGEEGLEVTVTSLPASGKSISFYKCELLDRNLKMLASVDGAMGGEIVPDTGGGA